MKRTNPNHIPHALHTRRIVVKVAELLATPRPVPSYKSANALATAALDALGYDKIDKNADPLFAQIVADCAQVMARVKGAA